MRTCSRIATLLALAALAAATTLGTRALNAQDKTSHKALLARVDSIAAKVSKMRGLKIKRKIARGVMTKAEVRKRLVERIAKEYKPGELEAEELALKRFGLLPHDTDYKKLVIDVLTDQIAGFYDPWERRLYIAGWQQSNLPAMAQDPVMAHEIDHALQDQHFNLKKMMKTDKHNGDATLAKQSLVEGDGLALMVEYMMAESGLTASPWVNDSVVNMMSSSAAQSTGMGSLDKAPLALREALLFPYIGGIKFVVHFRKHHPWSRIDKIYKKLPLSSEHVLHPKKYEQYERPDEVTARSLAVLAGYKKLYDNVSGELGLSIFLREHGTATKKAELAAAGWGGDRIAVYVPTGHGGKVAGTIGVHYAVFDEAADAIEYFEALEDAAKALSGGRLIKSDEFGFEYKTGSGLVFAAERRYDAVVLVVGAPEAKAQTLVEQVWARWKVRRR